MVCKYSFLLLRIWIEINILIADDHTVFREGLKQIIFQIEKITTITEAENRPKVIVYVLEKDFDIILFDISMLGKSGFEILKYLKKTKPNLPILIISVHLENQYAKRVL